MTTTDLLATESPPGREPSDTMYQNSLASKVGTQVANGIEPHISKPASPRYTFAVLDKEHRVMNPPLVEGLVRVGETCNLVASPKVGKSWMVYSLALSIVDGREWFGFPTNQGKVLLIDNELHPSTLRERIIRVSKAMVLNGEDWANQLEVWPLRGNLIGLSELAIELEQSIEKHDFKLIVLDAKYRFAELGGDENSNTSEARFYNEIDRIAERTGAAILLVHHATKGDQSSKRVTDVGSGAGAQSRAADCHLVIREHEQPGAFVLDAAVRSFAPVKPRVIRFEHPLWRLDSTLDASKLAGRGAKLSGAGGATEADGKARIIDAMKSGETFTNSTLRGPTKLGRERLERLLKAMINEQTITSQEGIRQGNRCREYRLNQ